MWLECERIDELVTPAGQRVDLPRPTSDPGMDGSHMQSHCPGEGEYLVDAPPERYGQLWINTRSCVAYRSW